MCCAHLFIQHASFLTTLVYIYISVYTSYIAISIYKMLFIIRIYKFNVLLYSVECHDILSNAMFNFKNQPPSRPPTIRDEGRDRLLRRSEHNARQGSRVVWMMAYLGDGIWKGISINFPDFIWILDSYVKCLAKRLWGIKKKKSLELHTMFWNWLHFGFLSQSWILLSQVY